ncbi:hypothetical protein HU200_063849 [Digitaria exilis]|uniref:Uncharacterized protein n=1 Tax=Digitaria exilis TaxID=1010633 RepID=A0A835DUX0_9POAL|nr:hypothetical protein HU200_063849 [Digitaria exilis]
MTASSTRATAPLPSLVSGGRDMLDADKLRFIEEISSDAGAVQERVLGDILARNGDAEYLLKCGLASASGRATFGAKVPMVTYDDLLPYIPRIAGGDSSPILTGPGYPVSEFFISSGTSGGERKLIPVVEDEFDRHWMPGGLAESVQPVNKGSGLYFHFVKSETMTPGGLPARTVTMSLLKSEQFKKLPLGIYTSPVAAITCEDTFQSMYAQLLCGLCQRHRVVRVGAVFASGVLPQLGPELAQFIRAQVSSSVVDNNGGAGIIARVWPNTKYVDTIVTGSMAQYVPTLNHYSGGLPIIFTMYASSECTVGINLRPLCDPSDVSYTIMPNMAYFEFLPVDDAAAATVSHQQHLVELADVEVGREYELVVTTYTGLSRYRVGDVIRVTGFHNAAPQVRLVRRSNVLLSVDSDKTDEADLQRAVERARACAETVRPCVCVFAYGGVESRLGAASSCVHGSERLTEMLRRFCGSWQELRPDVEEAPGKSSFREGKARLVSNNYVVYWEPMAMDNGDDGREGGDVMERCCLEMEEAMNSVYRQNRVADGSIRPLEIRVVRPGTFDELTDYAVAHGASMGQYKVPRCVKAPAIIQLLDSHVISRHFSPALPHWAPAQMFNPTDGNNPLANLMQSRLTDQAVEEPRIVHDCLRSEYGEPAFHPKFVPSPGFFTMGESTIARSCNRGTLDDLKKKRIACVAPAPLRCGNVWAFNLEWRFTLGLWEGALAFPPPHTWMLSS